MKKQGLKRALTLLVCLAMLTTLLASCKRRTPDEEDGESSLDNAEVSEFYDGYTIVVPSTASGDLRNEGELLKKLIRTYTGVEIKILDDQTHKEDGGKEILIGETNRADSSAASIPENGYVIEMLDNGNIVIGGSTQAITCDALTYYIHNLLYKSVISGEQLIETGYSYISEYKTVKVDSEYVIIYSQKLDDDSGQLNSNIDKEGAYDYEVDFAKSLAEKLGEKGIKVTAKSDKSAPTAKEILIGETNRAESKSFLDAVGYAQYGIGYENGKITVGGHSVATTMLACERLEKILTASSNASALLGKTSARSNFNWTLDFPCYDGAAITGVSESYYNGMQCYIEDTDADEFAAYCEKLENVGYVQTMSNEIDGNLFAAYTNEKILIYVYFVPFESSVRLIVGNAQEIEFPESRTEAYYKVTDVSITQMQLDYASNTGGMCYVVTLQDGSYFVIDSGSTTSQNAPHDNKDHVRLWNLLNKLNKRKDGKIIIRGWFITHEHADHIMVFRNFCDTYGSKVTIEKYYECVVPTSVAYNSRNPDYHVISGKVDEANKKVDAGFDMVMLHTGMKFSMYGAEINILYTVEDLYPKRLNYFNEASTAFKITSGGGSVFITGDIYKEASTILVNRYPTALKSDIVQVAHHGNQGATKEFYQAVQAKTALWPCAQDYGSDSLEALIKRQNEVGTIDRYVYESISKTEQYTAEDYSVELKLPYVHGKSIKHYVSTEDQYK